MHHLVRLVLLVAILGGGIALVVHLQRDSDPTAHADADAPAAHTAPSRSAASVTQDGEWLVVRYDLVAADAIVIRLSDDDLVTCNFKSHTGPRSDHDRIARHITVDYEIVPAAAREATVARMGRACDGYWYTFD